MKILMLVDYIEGFKCESAYTIRYKTAKEISLKGHKVTLIAPSLNSKRSITQKESETLRVIFTPGLLPAKFRKGGFGILDIVFKIKFILFGKYDVIHATSGHRPAQLIPSLFGKLFFNATIIDEWWEWFGKNGIADTREGVIGALISRYDTLLEMPTKCFYDGIITITTVLKDRLNEKTRSRSLVLHGGAETGSLQNYELNEARAELGLSKDLFIVGMSSLVEDDYTDNKLFFEAFNNLQKKYGNLRLFVTGNPQYISAFLENYPASDRVIYKGWLSFSEYNKFLSACNLFALPYRNCPRNAGRWPNKIGDYFCLNRPVLTNPTGDLNVFFNKYNVGFLCDESAEDFRKKVDEIIQNSNELSKTHKDSLFVAQEVLSFEKRINSILSFYEKCCKKSQVSSGQNNS